MWMLVSRQVFLFTNCLWFLQRKLLAVYLHHDGSILSNVFCSQALCQVSVVDYLTANFVVWGWDLTHEANKARYCRRPLMVHFMWHLTVIRQTNPGTVVD